MMFADYVLRKTLSTNGATKLLWTAVRRWLVHSFNDPPCSIILHGRLLRLPLSHELPAYLKLLPQYDRLPGRLGSFLRNRYGALTVLDVGANIGDTIAALQPGQHDRFLALEPDPKFNRYLRENWNQPNIRILNLLCASRTGAENYIIDEKFGTASFFRNPRGVELQTITLDDLLAATPDFANVQLVKIDTDGNDFDVLAGARQTLAGQPAVLFECDVFGNRRYIEDCLETLALFSAAGYHSMLLYEKFGYPMGRYLLDDLGHFRELLFYQLTKKFIYYDILLMKEQDLLPFYALEREFFLAAVTLPALRATAEKAR